MKQRFGLALSGVVLAVVQGQGKADLATGYELDIIAAAVVGGASLVTGWVPADGVRGMPRAPTGAAAESCRSRAAAVVAAK